MEIERKKRVSKKIGRLDDQELWEMGQAAQKELDQFIENNPHLKEIQDRIETHLNNSDNIESRLADLGLYFKNARLAGS